MTTISPTILPSSPTPPLLSITTNTPPSPPGNNNPRRNRIKPVLNLSKSTIRSSSSSRHSHTDRPLTPNNNLSSCYNSPVQSPLSVYSPNNNNNYYNSPVGSPCYNNNSRSPLPSPGGILQNEHRPSPSQSPVFASSNCSSNNSTIIPTSGAALNSGGNGRIFNASGGGNNYGRLQPAEIHNNIGPTATETDHQLNHQQQDLNHLFQNHPELRQRLQKPCSSLLVSKFRTARKEFLLSMANNNNSNKTAFIATTTTTANSHSSTSAMLQKPTKDFTMLHFAFWNPPKLPEQKKLKLPTKSSSPWASNNDKDSEAEQHSSSTTETLISTTKTIEVTTSTAPRVKVGADGELIIDEQSLVIETSECDRAKKHLSEMETVSIGNKELAGFWAENHKKRKKKKRGTEWSEGETLKFYRALSMCGTDFSMMAMTLFKNQRSREELKAKFKREDRVNPGQVSGALEINEFDPIILENEGEPVNTINLDEEDEEEEAVAAETELTVNNNEDTLGVEDESEIDTLNHGN